MPEREVKLSPPPGYRLPALDDLAADLTAEDRGTVELQATYYDTADLRLARSGASLRHRSDEGWMVKLPEGGDGALLVRAEHRFPGPVGAPPDAALDLLRAMIRTAPVSAVTRLRTRRHRIDLLTADGKPHVEVVDDEVSVLDGRRVAARFREVEVELAPDAPPARADLVVEKLREAGAGPPDPTPKVVRALGPRALEPPDVLPTSHLLPSDTAGDVVRGAIARSVARLIAHDPGVRLGDDPEYVHQARVATRRLRSDLRTFRTLLESDWSVGLRTELRWLGTELGQVRDAEVLLDLLRDTVAELPATDRSAADRVLSPLVARWQDARLELLEALRSPRYLQLLDRLVDAARVPALTPKAAARADEVIPGLVRAPWRHLRRAVDALGSDPPDEALHDIRIRAKRARYAAEAAASIVGKPARAFARAVSEVQEVLGDHHDAVVAGAWIREVATTVGAPDAFVAGSLAALVRLDEQQARRDWPTAWKSANRKSLRVWI